LIISTGALFVYVSIQIGHYLAALACVWGFYFLWAALYSVGRDPNLVERSAQHQFRVVVFTAAAVAFLSVCGGVYFLIQGRYSEFFGSFASIGWLIWAYQKYRNNLAAWMGYRKNAKTQQV
jgi:hypothetical protein